MNLDTLWRRLKERWAALCAQHRWAVPALAGSACLVTAGVALLLGRGASGASPADGASDAWSGTLWPLLATLLVLGLLYGCLAWLRNLTQGGRASTGGEGASLSVQRSIRLGKDQSLHQVRFGTQTLLVGASPAGLTLLARAVEDEGAPSAAQSEPVFSRLLENKLEDAKR